MNFLPCVIRAEYRGEHQIHLAFNDGVEATLDFSPWLHGPVFEPLRDNSYFQRFFLDGGTIAWPNGADIAPETLYERARSEAARADEATLGDTRGRVKHARGDDRSGG